MKRTALIAVAMMVIGSAVAAQDVTDVDQDGVFPGASGATQTPQQGIGEGFQATLIGVGWDACEVGSIDTATGTWTLLGNAGFTGCNSLSRDAAGVFYSVADPGVGFALITIDPASGAGTQVAPLTPELSIRAVAFSPSGALYAVADMGTSDDELWTIDTSTGNATLVGTMTGFSAVQGLAFHPIAGTLYATDNVQGLLTVDPATGAATDVNPGVGGTGDVQTLTVLPNGEVFGARYDLFSIDPMTGVYTVVATGGYPDVRGVDFLGPIPVELMDLSIE